MTSSDTPQKSLSRWWWFKTIGSILLVAVILTFFGFYLEKAFSGFLNAQFPELKVVYAALQENYPNQNNIDVNVNYAQNGTSTPMKTVTISIVNSASSSNAGLLAMGRIVCTALNNAGMKIDDLTIEPVAEKDFLFFHYSYSPGGSSGSCDWYENENPAATQIMYNISQYASPILGVSSVDSSTSFWVTNNGQLVMATSWNKLFSQTFSTMTNTAQYQAADQLTAYAAQQLENAGYKPDDNNTSILPTDSPFYTVRSAFFSADGSSHCVIEPPADQQYNAEWDMECANTTDINAAYQKELPFLQALGNDKNVALSSLQIGNFAAVGVSNEQVGFENAILVNTENGWRVLYQGQNPPSCSLIKQNQVPQTIYGQCQ